MIYFILSNEWMEEIICLLEKLTKNKIFILLSSLEAMNLLDKKIWIYKKSSFIPHGTYLDEFAAKQPILLHTSLDNVNEADILIVTNHEDISNIKTFKKIYYVFSHEDIKQAREQWQKCMNKNLKVEFCGQGRT